MDAAAQPEVAWMPVSNVDPLAELEVEAVALAGRLKLGLLEDRLMHR